MINDIKFVHPIDMQDGAIVISANDITTNFPYNAQSHLVFDHHSSEALCNSGQHDHYIIDTQASSAARDVWRHYGGDDAFPVCWQAMMAAVDKADSAQQTCERS